MAGMRRRDFIAAAGSTAVAWPLAVRAQQPAMPVIGFLDSDSPSSEIRTWRRSVKGLAELGYVEARMSRSSTLGGYAI